MAGSYHQIFIQCIFAVHGRDSSLRKEWRKDVFRYMSGIIENTGNKSIIVNGVADHVHLFLGIKPSSRLSDIVRDVKNNSSNFINKSNFVQGKFSWQEGYGAFSYSKSQVEQVYDYVFNQEEHHRKRTFREEYCDFLKKFEIPFEERFLFDWIDE